MFLFVFIVLSQLWLWAVEEKEEVNGFLKAKMNPRWFEKGICCQVMLGKLKKINVFILTNSH